MRGQSEADLPTVFGDPLPGHDQQSLQKFRILMRDKTVKLLDGSRFEETCPCIGLFGQKRLSRSYVFALQNQEHARYRLTIVGHEGSAGIEQLPVSDHIFDMGVPDMKPGFGAALTIETSYDH